MVCFFYHKAHEGGTKGTKDNGVMYGHKGADCVCLHEYLVYMTVDVKCIAAPKCWDGYRLYVILAVRAGENRRDCE
jgi:hypothetical protein